MAKPGKVNALDRTLNMRLPQQKPRTRVMLLFKRLISPMHHRIWYESLGMDNSSRLLMPSERCFEAAASKQGGVFSYLMTAQVLYRYWAASGAFLGVTTR